MSILSCQSLTLANRLKDVSLSLPPQSLTGIVGPNGAGKTTLLKCLAGLLSPDMGSVSLGGTALDRMPATARARKIGYLPAGHAAAWDMNAYDIVALGRYPHGRWPRSLDASDEAAIHAALKATDAEDFASRAIGRLSSGERARVMMARVLAGEPDIILADEPLANLDPAHQFDMLSLLHNRARAGGTVAIVLHDLALAARFCDRLMVLKEGRLAADGPPATVLTPALLARVFELDAGLSSGGTLVVSGRSKAG